MTKRYVGIDLGGTNLKLGLVSAEGELLRRHGTPTEAAEGPAHVLARMADAVRQLAEQAGLALQDVAAVGVGVPGPLDSEAGVIHFTPNLAGWINVPVRDTLQDALGRTVVVENDANAAAYGEFRVGAGRDVQSMFVLTLGTGVGGGIIQDGRLLRGASDTGAELGHVIVQYGGRLCGCGNRGCLEAYASATAVVDRFRRDATVSELARRDALEAKDVFEAAADGDKAAARIVSETAEYLAVGITSVLHALNPEMVVLTGGMMGAGETFLDEIRRHVRALAFPSAWEACDVRASTLGGDAGILGSALAAEAFDRTGQRA
ncbi:MAG: ROK family protein [Planctomycetota bacterium]|nr:ROK family protein [Planctomycetota bacterium]